MFLLRKDVVWSALAYVWREYRVHLMRIMYHWQGTCVKKGGGGVGGGF